MTDQNPNSDNFAQDFASYWFGRGYDCTKIGEGGFADVFRLQHQETGFDVALKITLLKDQITHSRAGYEGFMHQMAEGSPNVIEYRSHSIFEWADGLRMSHAMKYVEGTTLYGLKDAPVAKKLEVLEALCDTGKSFREKEMIHGDFKPANVMVDNSEEVKVVDFGIAKRLADPCLVDNPRVILGTAGYVPPEQILGYGRNHGTDVWAIGTIAYQLLFGSHPFVGDGDPAIKVLHRTAAFDSTQWKDMRKRVNEELVPQNPDTGEIADPLMMMLHPSNTQRSRPYVLENVGYLAKMVREQLSKGLLN